MTQYFFRSDFSIKESSQNYTTYPFTITFWTDTPAKSYKCSWDGNTYHNCHVDDAGALIVDFIGHGLGVGVLKAEKVFYLPDGAAADGTRRVSSVGWYDIKLAINHDNVVTDEETGVQFAGATISFPSGKSTTDVSNDDTTVYNDIEAEVQGTKLILNM